jgi:hypothetical protein
MDRERERPRQKPRQRNTDFKHFKVLRRPVGSSGQGTTTTKENASQCMNHTCLFLLTTKYQDSPVMDHLRDVGHCKNHCQIDLTFLWCSAAALLDYECSRWNGHQSHTQCK